MDRRWSTDLAKAAGPEWVWGSWHNDEPGWVILAAAGVIVSLPVVIYLNRHKLRLSVPQCVCTAGSGAPEGSS
jgi:hypothetical protein